MLAEPKCYFRHCKHFKGVIQPDGTEMTEVYFCSAFPKGIPDDIASGKNDHSKPSAGQMNEIVFEKGKFEWEE